MLASVENKFVICIGYLFRAVFFDNSQAVVGLPHKCTDLNKRLGNALLSAALDSCNRFKKLFVFACFAVIGNEKCSDTVKRAAEKQVQEKPYKNNCSDHNAADYQ